MKIILVLLLLTASAFSQSLVEKALQERIYGNAGIKPEVTATQLPANIEASFRAAMRDPDSIVIESWTMPELKTTMSGGKKIGWWSMEISARGINGYGGPSAGRFLVTIKDGRVDGVRAIR